MAKSDLQLSDEGTIRMPKWFWALLCGFVAWMTHQTAVTNDIRGTQRAILEEHERRIQRLEDRYDTLFDRVIEVEKTRINLIKG